MFSLRTHALICGGILGALILLAVLGNALQASGIVTDLGRFQTPAQILFFGLFVALGFSAVPLMVKLVVGAQVQIGNADRPVIKPIVAHHAKIIWALWTLMFLGMLLAVPAAIDDGMFGPGAARKLHALMLGKSQGTLAAAPGMTVTEMTQRSTLKIEEGTVSEALNQRQFAGGGIFDFEVAGTGLVFQTCRYYFIVTRAADDPQIEMMSIGTAPDKLTREELEAANNDLRGRLKDQGWLTAHHEYATEEERQLHGGNGASDQGWIWLKNGTVLHVLNRRLDDAVPGEDPETAGEWIQYVDLWRQADYPGFEELVFAPAQ
jgi:hypothetical protein